MLVAENLDFDVPRSLDQFLQKACPVSECGFGFSSAFDNFLFQFVRRPNDPHASTAAAPRSFQHERVSHLLRHCLGFAEIVRKHRGCRNDRHVHRIRHDSGGGLVAEQAHGFRRRSDECDPFLYACLREFRIFREQTVAGMHRVRSGLLGNANHVRNRQISAYGTQPFADSVCLVGFEAMKRQFVFFSEYGDSPFLQLVRRPHDSNGDFASIGH